MTKKGHKYKTLSYKQRSAMRAQAIEMGKKNITHGLRTKEFSNKMNNLLEMMTNRPDFAMANISREIWLRLENLKEMEEEMRKNGNEVDFFSNGYVTGMNMLLKAMDLNNKAILLRDRLRCEKVIEHGVDDGIKADFGRLIEGKKKGDKDEGSEEIKDNQEETEQIQEEPKISGEDSTFIESSEISENSQKTQEIPENKEIHNNQEIFREDKRVSGISESIKDTETPSIGNGECEICNISGISDGIGEKDAEGDKNAEEGNLEIKAETQLIVDELIDNNNKKGDIDEQMQRETENQEINVDIEEKNDI